MSSTCACGTCQRGVAVVPSFDRVIVGIGDQLVALDQKGVASLLLALENAAIAVFQVEDTLFGQGFNLAQPPAAGDTSDASIPVPMSEDKAGMLPAGQPS